MTIKDEVTARALVQLLKLWDEGFLTDDECEQALFLLYPVEAPA